MTVRTIMKMAVISATATSTLLASAGTAMAASVNVIPPGWLTAPGGANSAGVGFCLSQVAQNPDAIEGVPNFGTAVRGIASEGPGAVAAKIDEARYPLCGGPGSGE